jgi:proteasome lid subunit RPN8/RPN11
MGQAAYQEIFRHARAEYPNEACGVLLRAAGGEVIQAVACSNVAALPRSRYQIDPPELIAVQRRARERGLEIAGFYHSHPDAEAEPSATDAAEAYWTGCSYVIAAVRGGDVIELRSFRLGVNGRLEEEPVVVSTPAQL